MQIQIDGQTIELEQGDITLQEVDAIVNARYKRHGKHVLNITEGRPVF
jgi:hypothetical protein